MRANLTWSVCRQSTSAFVSRGPVSLNCLTSVISISFYFSAVMYTLIPARLLSVCRSGVCRSSWRGGAGIIKPWRGTSGTLLSAIRGSSQRVLIFLGPVNVQPGLFSIGTRRRYREYTPAPPSPTPDCLLGLLILSQANTLSGMSCWALCQSRLWKSHVEIQRKAMRPQFTPITTTFFFPLHTFFLYK